MLSRLPLSLTLPAVLWVAFAAAAEPNRPESPQTEASESPADKSPRPAPDLFEGQVVMLRDALKRRNIAASEEFDNQVVLETAKGELIPIVPDWRGRAFYQDERLRNRRVQLVGIRKEGVPYLQVLIVFTFDEMGVRQYTDYWCDICSIPMYEIKPCDCCQQPIRLRFQPRDLPDYLSLDRRKTGPAADGSGEADRESQSEP